MTFCLNFVKNNNFEWKSKVRFMKYHFDVNENQKILSCMWPALRINGTLYYLGRRIFDTIWMHFLSINMAICYFVSLIAEIQLIYNSIYTPPFWSNTYIVYTMNNVNSKGGGWIRKKQLSHNINKSLCSKMVNKK